MTTEVKNVELKILQADKDKALTNGITYSSVGGTVYLSANDSSENWHEISEDEYNKIMEEIELEATPAEFRNIENTTENN